MDSTQIDIAFDFRSDSWGKDPKERAALEEMYHHGQCPWALWREDRLNRGKRIHAVEGMDPVIPA